ncbi:MAG: thiamine diphosphokinase [Firmicutes bacterium]|nr:thiamine diphosphokinase [Bacillota bacterium]
MQKIVIIANGVIGDREFCRRQIRKGDYLICVDGGLHHALAMGLRPHLVVGDGDSLDADLYRELERLSPEFLQYPEINQEESDLELALNHAVTLGFKEIVIFGALGGERADHGFINYLLLLIPLKKGIRARIIDGRQEIQLMDRVLEVEGRAGDYLSLFSLTPRVTGVVTEGLKYSLHRETLYFASTRGLSNQFSDSLARLSIESGLLLVIKIDQSIN